MEDIVKEAKEKVERMVEKESEGPKRHVYKYDKYELLINKQVSKNVIYTKYFFLTIFVLLEKKEFKIFDYFSN